MSAPKHSPARGFTLVEILIVVVILGILAAIVIPQFVHASQDARQNSLSTQLNTLRGQIGYYRVQHGDAIPNLVTNWTPLTSTSTYNGTTYGPYMQATPVNPENNLSTVMDGTNASTPSTAVGFVYDYASGTGTGRIWGTDTTGMTILSY